MTHGIEESADGLFALCVFNAEDASDSELEDIFGEFGLIVDLHRSKNLVFVRYGNLDEAVSCYEAMQNHSVYRVKPGRRKDKSEGFSERRNGSSGGFSERRSGGGGGFSGKKSFGDDNNQRGFQEDNTQKNVGRTERSVKQKPPCVPVIPGVSDENTEQPAPPAKGVMIANIPPRMMQCNIYELCVKNKACVLNVEMGTINHSNYTPVYYAFVYVKTDEDVKNIISGLNNFKLDGYQWLVYSLEELGEDCKAL